MGCNNGCGFGGGGCLWIILIIILLCCCCGGNSWGGNGCGCNNGRGAESRGALFSGKENSGKEGTTMEQRVTALYFSPTHGTRAYVRAVAAAIPGEHREVDLTRPEERRKEYHFTENDLVILGVPVYYGRVPEVEGLLDGLHGGNTPVILLAVYGNRLIDDALVELLTKKSYSLTYGARNLRRTIQRELEDPMATQIIDSYEHPISQVKATVENDAIKLYTL